MLALLRLREARLSLRNAAGGRLAVAESAVLEAMGQRDRAIDDFEALKRGAGERFRRIRRVAELYQFDLERRDALLDIVAADNDVGRVEDVAKEAREVLGRCERELRRVDKVLTHAQRMRLVAERKAEQAAHDDLANFNHFVGREVGGES
jgi:hypothetical protein